MENNYDFRKELMQFHRPDYRCPYTPAPEEISLEQVTIFLPPDAGEVLLTAARDFQDYLFTSMNAAAVLSRKKLPGMNLTVGTFSQLGKTWD